MRRLLLLLCLGLMLAGCGRAGSPVRSRQQPPPTTAEPAEPEAEQDPEEKHP